ncbi:MULTISPECIES: RedB protein [unclassified Corallococcus]|uniref:RedB protein n=1 Tax=unclassified Corallococcus TaxID=2685029 RepID=UPI001A8C9C86|nr:MULTISPECIES: RedB protein [unclassified Corallococcus]MBN9685978.1 RedB protein [Corallococcus sp. NCSPR001]WAS82583.1 RedB protein [Corallococcus sp. NCRR]
MAAPDVSHGPVDVPARTSVEEGLKHSARERRALPWWVGGWFVASALGLGLVWSHASAPGLAATPPVRLPERFPRAPDTWTLLVFLHPLCPCSRATLAELTKLLDRHGARLSTRVFVWAPRDAPPDFERSELWMRAMALPGARVVADVDGQVARELGARTSGQVVLYSPDGEERFAGGITSARGHEGDSAGGRALRDLLAAEVPSAATAPVYGCALETPPSPVGHDT